MKGIWTSIQYVVLEAYPTHKPNGISIESAVFLQYTLGTSGQMDGWTDRTTTKLDCKNTGCLRYNKYV